MAVAVVDNSWLAWSAAHFCVLSLNDRGILPNGRALECRMQCVLHRDDYRMELEVAELEAVVADYGSAKRRLRVATDSRRVETAMRALGHRPRDAGSPHHPSPGSGCRGSIEAKSASRTRFLANFHISPSGAT